MKEIYKQIPLYRFLSYCNEKEMKKNVLDCGAGGNQPPLNLFAENGYKTYGIEFCEEEAKLANEYGFERGNKLNINVGDMRKIEYNDENFSFVYSYNSVFHMKKTDVIKSIEEMKRVLKPEGLMFVNFLSIDDHRCGIGPIVGKNEYEQFDDELPVIHSYYEYSEAEKYFENMDILYKEIRVLERRYKGEKIKQGFIDYILRKK